MQSNINGNVPIGRAPNPLLLTNFFELCVLLSLIRHSCQDLLNSAISAVKLDWLQIVFEEILASILKTDRYESI